MSRRPLELSDSRRREWDSLAESLTASPFLRPGWIVPWWDAFGAGRLELLEVRRGRSLEALQPIVLHRGMIRSPTNWHTPEFGPLGTEPGADALFEQLFARRSGMVEIGWLAAGDSRLGGLQAAAAAARYAVHTRIRERSPTVQLDGDWPAYERALSGNLRRDLGRRQRRLEELGEVTFEVSDTPSALPDAFALESLGWKGNRGTAMSSRPRTAAFYQRIARWAAERGWLRLAFLRLDQRPVAFHFALEAGGTYYAIKGGFDPAFSPYSPGALMIHSTLRRAFNEGLDRYELLGGDDWYKRRWTSAARTKLVFQAFAPTPLGGVHRIAQVYARPRASAILAATSSLRRRSARPES